jgi:hypothetical protein
MKYLIYSIILFSFACKSKKESGTKDKTSREVTSDKSKSEFNSANDTLNYFTASFYSIGSGIDRRIKAEYDTFFGKFQDETKANLNRLVFKWGKEGELDYCFNLTGLNSDLKTKFINESSAILKKSERVHLKFNQECKSN